jgi:glycosyltransferase involved in cell wall biosynthesis
LKIVYLLESAGLCGGVKVVLRQAEALSKRGHRVIVACPSPYPHWFEGQISYEQRDPTDPGFLRGFDHIIATTPTLIRLLYGDLTLRPRLVHLIQGYEGHFPECVSFREIIVEAYGLPVPKLTVSNRLSQEVLTRFPGTFVTSVGQGLERDYFHTIPGNFCSKAAGPVDRVFLIGPLSISVKRILIGLLAFKRFQSSHREVRLVRISPVDTREAEQEFLTPITEYHTGVPPRMVGDLLRTGNGILLFPSGPEEGFGLPAIEAMACGVPVVLTDTPSNRSFSALGDYAVFVPVDDPNLMAEGLFLLANDPLERKRLVIRGLEVASHYSFERVAGHLEGFLNGLRNGETGSRYPVARL